MTVPPDSTFAVDRFDSASALRPSLFAPVFGPMVNLSPAAGAPLIVTETLFIWPAVVLLIVSVAPVADEYGTTVVALVIENVVAGEPATVTVEPTGKPDRPVPSYDSVVVEFGMV